MFPTVGKGGFVFAAGYGKGILYENGAMTGYCDATQLSVGAQIGGQSCSELVFLQTPEALQRFKSGDLALDAQVSAIAADQKATRAARYQEGVAVAVPRLHGPHGRSLRRRPEVPLHPGRLAPVEPLGVQPLGRLAPAGSLHSRLPGGPVAIHDLQPRRATEHQQAGRDFV